jgi:lipopolysaccharide export system protein LptA
LRYLIILLTAFLVLAQAQDSAPSAAESAETAGTEGSATANRIIRISFQDGTTSGNIRFGPISYTHPEPDGITATVSNLTILARLAELRVPPAQQGETLLSEAEGEREASFEGGVRVLRGRLTAEGPGLVYSEATGLGILNGTAKVHIEPAEDSDDPVDITAGEVEFDVDTDLSTSRGDVTLTSGRQTAEAEQLVYAEERSLGVLSSSSGQVQIIRLDDDGSELVITADEIRVLTDDELLYATGNVTVADGSVTSYGDAVFFDDRASRAEVLGSPARSIDEAEGIELTGARLEHRTDLGVVSTIDASVPSEFELGAFSLVAGELD